MLDIFGLLHLHSVNYIPIQKYFMIFSASFLLRSGLIFIYWNKPKFWIMHIVFASFISAISWNITLWLHNMPQVKFSMTQTILCYALFP